MKKGRWHISLLDKAVESLIEKYDDDFYAWWEIAYEVLHVKGFHEALLKVDDVRKHSVAVEKLLNTLKKELYAN